MIEIADNKNVHPSVHPPYTDPWKVCTHLYTFSVHLDSQSDAK